MKKSYDLLCFRNICNFQRHKVKPWFYSFLSGSGKLIVVTSYFVILGQIQIQAGDLAPGAVHTFLANV